LIFSVELRNFSGGLARGHPLPPIPGNCNNVLKEGQRLPGSKEQLPSSGKKARRNETNSCMLAKIEKYLKPMDSLQLGSRIYSLNA